MSISSTSFGTATSIREGARHLAREGAGLADDIVYSTVPKESRDEVGNYDTTPAAAALEYGASARLFEHRSLCHASIFRRVRMIARSDQGTRQIGRDVCLHLELRLAHRRSCMRAWGTTLHALANHSG